MRNERTRVEVTSKRNAGWIGGAGAQGAEIWTIIWDMSDKASYILT